ncbi:hypothetical protein WDW89_15730 [Deltaproteobacteria bacterium TL4]
MRVEIDLPEQIASILTNLPLTELKKRIITDNGLTVAQEEEILSLNPEDSTHAMTPKEALAYLKTRHNHEN